ncbi:hypothetical protein LAUMK142_04018 [Mycobacterium pseudokansasii]|uniref:Uncharacterized protein n=1 Tax=Mycobacterium pseudokansasii TaxID=2341080 RepID=A0A498QSA2_9MYCO|nr:hypothetical protein LAUMK142_04018 [Mycobacterium pseudokansasii]
MLTQVVWHLIVVQDLLLTRDHGGADEVTGLGQDVLKVLGVDCQGHRLIIYEI